jgi:hypothetical protein
VGEHLTDVATFSGFTRKAQLVCADRAYGYRLGGLSTARETFTEVTGLAVEWDNGSPEEEVIT